MTRLSPALALCLLLAGCASPDPHPVQCKAIVSLEATDRPDAGGREQDRAEATGKVAIELTWGGSFKGKGE